MIKKKISLKIWIIRFRKLGKIAFFLGNDCQEIWQVVVKKQDLIQKLKNFHQGDLVKIYGEINQDKDDFSRKEIELISITLINKSKTPPFMVTDDNNVNEDTRYHYRYLDLRSVENQKILRLKSDFLWFTRLFFAKKGFVEIETPILSQYSPEGANCFYVLSNWKDRYYTLPQSPQIFKQLLMVGGVKKYFQIAKSFRNEGARSDRQIEFSQLDIEISFSSVNSLIKLTEKYLRFVLSKVFKEIKISFSIMSYQESIKHYRSEKPDLRNEEEKKDNSILKFVWIIDWPLFGYNSEEKNFFLVRHPFTAIKKKFLKGFMKNKSKLEDIITDSFDLVCNGEEILSGSLRIFKQEIQKKVFLSLNYNEEKIKKHFGYFLEALSFAAPPHGGLGLGIDRLLSLLLNLKSLKKTIAFPKNIDGSCPLTKTPNYLIKK